MMIKSTDIGQIGSPSFLVSELQQVKEKLKEISELGAFSEYLVVGNYLVYPDNTINMSISFCFDREVLHNLYHGAGWPSVWEYTKISKDGRVFDNKYHNYEEKELVSIFNEEIKEGVAA